MQFFVPLSLVDRTKKKSRKNEDSSAASDTGAVRQEKKLEKERRRLEKKEKKEHEKRAKLLPRERGDSPLTSIGSLSSSKVTRSSNSVTTHSAASSCSRSHWKRSVDTENGSLTSLSGLSSLDRSSQANRSQHAGGSVPKRPPRTSLAASQMDWGEPCVSPLPLSRRVPPGSSPRAAPTVPASRPSAPPLADLRLSCLQTCYVDSPRATGPMETLPLECADVTVPPTLTDELALLWNHLSNIVADYRARAVPWDTFFDPQMFSIPRRKKEFLSRCNLNLPQYSANYLAMFYGVVLTFLFFANLPFFVTMFVSCLVIHIEERRIRLQQASPGGCAVGGVSAPSRDSQSPRKPLQCVRPVSSQVNACGPMRDSLQSSKLATSLDDLREMSVSALARSGSDPLSHFLQSPSSDANEALSEDELFESPEAVPQVPSVAKTSEYAATFLGYRITYRQMADLHVMIAVFLFCFFDGLTTLLWVAVLGALSVLPHAMMRKPVLYDDEEMEKTRPKLVQRLITMVILILLYLEGKDDDEDRAKQGAAAGAHYASPTHSPSNATPRL